MASWQTHAPGVKTQISTQQTALAHAIASRKSGDEDRSTQLPELLFFRREQLTQPCACMVEPSVVFVAQGAKQMLVGDKAFPYDPEHFLINSIDLPASSQVIEASPEKPCDGLVLKLDLILLAALIAQGDLTPSTERPADRGLSRGSLSPQLLAPFQRLLALLDEPSIATSLQRDPKARGQVLYLQQCCI